MIYTDRTITVRKGESKIDEPIVVYRGDYELEVRFTIMNSRFKFMSGTNLIETEKASFGQMAILTPYGGNIFSDIVRCSDGTVTFVLTESMINQIEEIGLYSFQIRLYDYNKESRVSIPPIEFGIEVREPIASEDHDNSVNNAIVGYSIAKVVNPEEENVGDTFDEDGNYNKTKWETGDRISQGKLNKIEDAVDKINQNEIADVAALDKKITNNYNVLDSTKADKNEIFTMANMGQDIKEAMTGGSVAVVGENTILTDNIVDGQITKEKTDFLQTVGNIFNKDDIIENKKIQANGTIIDDNSFSISNDIRYLGDSLTFQNVSAILCYDIDGKVLGTNNPSDYTSCHHFKVCFLNYNKNIVRVYPTGYDGYMGYAVNIPYLMYSVNSERDIEDDSITYEKINFITVGPNLFNADAVTTGYTMDPNGNLTGGYSDQFYIDIKVNPDTVYNIKGNSVYAKAVWLDSDKKSISAFIVGSFNGNVTVTSPDTAFYIRYNSTLNALNELMICENEAPAEYEGYSLVMPYLKINPSTAIPKGGIDSEMLSEQINKAINDLEQLKMEDGAVVLGDSTGNNMGLNAIWVSNSPTITTTTEDTCKILTLSNSTSSAGIYQFAPRGFNNTGSGEVYVHLEYEVLEGESGAGTFRDNNAGTYFSVTVGEHEYTYKTSATGGYALKYEIHVAAGHTISIRFKRVSILDFANMNFNTVDVKHYFDTYNNYENLQMLPVFLKSQDMPDKFISANMLDDNLYNMITPSKWAGKSFVSYGDSNTAGGGWQDYAVTLLGLTHTNKGIGGSTLCGDASSTNCGFSDTRINSFPTQVDVVTIMFGTNDWSQNKTIGEDDGDVTTFKGAMGVTIRKIQEKYPKTRIIIMSPPFRTDSTWDVDPVLPTRGAGILGFGDCCSEMARKYGCSFIDTYRDMGVNKYNFKEFLKEETWPVHLNDEGKKRLGRLLVSKLKEIEPLD